MKNSEVLEHTVSTLSYSRYTKATFKVWKDIVLALDYFSDTVATLVSNTTRTYRYNSLI